MNRTTLQPPAQRAPQISFRAARSFLTSPSLKKIPSCKSLQNPVHPVKTLLLSFFLTLLCVPLFAADLPPADLDPKAVNLVSWPTYSLTSNSGDPSPLKARTTLIPYISNTAQGDLWLQLDAGADKPAFNRVRLTGPTPLGGRLHYVPTGAEIFIADNIADFTNTTLKPVASLTNQTSPILDLSFPHTKGRYLRLKLLGKSAYQLGSLAIYATDPRPFHPEYPISESTSASATIAPLSGWWHGYDARGGRNLLSDLKPADMTMLDDLPIMVLAQHEDASAKITLSQPFNLTKAVLGVDSSRPQHFPQSIKIEASLNDIDYHTLLDQPLTLTPGNDAITLLWPSSKTPGFADARYLRITIPKDPAQPWKVLNRLQFFGKPQPAPTAIASPPSGKQIATVKVPVGSALSAVIINDTGRVVRTLHRLESVAPSDARPLFWDQKDDAGNPVPAGAYTWRAVASSLSAQPMPAIGNTSTPTYENPGAGASTWVTGISFDPHGNWFQTASWDESGKSIRKYNADASASWVYNFNGLFGVVCDGPFLYALQADLGGESRAQSLFRFNSSDGQINPFPGSKPYSGVPISAPAPLPKPENGAHNLTQHQQRQAVGVTAITLQRNTIWITHYRDNKVQAFDKATGKQTSEFPLISPLGIAATPEGNLWISSPSGLGLYSPQGKCLTLLNDIQSPCALALGGPQNLLYATDHKTGQVVCINPATRQTLWRRGRFQTPGPVHDDSFRWSGSSAIAVAPDGKYAVADPHNQRTQIFNPDGSLFKSLKADFAQPGPFAQAPSANSNSATLLNGRFQYQVDLKTGQWKFTHNFLTADEAFMDGMAMRRTLKNGKDYLFYFDPWACGLVVYHLPKSDQLPRRAAILAAFWTGPDNNLDHQWKPAPYSWTDTNADGQIQESECKRNIITGKDINYFAWRNFVDAQGHFWIYNLQSKQVEKIPLQGFDANDNPLYDWAARVAVLKESDPHIGPNLEGLLRIDPQSGDILLAGNPPWSTPNRKPSGLFHQGGFAVARFSQDGKLKSAFATPMEMASFTSDGRFVYAAHNPDPQVTDVYDPCGLLLARIIPGKEFAYTRAWMDTAAPLSAFQLPNTNQHHLFTEDVVYSRHLHWKLIDDPAKTLYQQGSIQVTP
jgi:hypothetical protein